MKLNPLLKYFWKAKKKIKVLHGGRASSKTEDTAGVLIHLSSKYKIKVACVRKFQANIKQSVYSVLKKKIINDEYFKQFFSFTETNITSTTGSEFIFLGWERNTDQIKGLDDVDIMWIEEGHTLTKEQWQIIKDTVLLRKDNAMVIIVFNPYLDTDFIWKEFVIKEHPEVITRSINYTDNPFLPKTALELIEKEKEIMDDDDFNHVYLGYPKSENEEAFIKRKWIEASIDAHLKLGIDVVGEKVIGYDVADSGADTCAVTVRHGILTTMIKEWKAKEDELEESAEKVYNIAEEIGASISYDCIGVGASAGSTFKRLNSERNLNIEYNKFDAGDAVQNPNDEYKENRTNKDHFENLKAQTWQDVADRFLHTYNAVVNGKEFDEDMIISISSECDLIEKLKIELSAPKKDKSKRGLIKVESKDDLKKRGIPSPNCFIAGTKILTSSGEVNIEDLKIGDSVITPMGISKVIYTHKNEAQNVITNMGLTGTAEHKVFTWNEGWKELRFLSLCDIIEYSKIGRLKWQIMNLLYTKEKCSQFSTQVDIIAQEGIGVKMLKMSDFYTEGYGLKIMGKFLMGITSIILMVIGATTKLKILKWLNQKSIKDYIWKKDLKIKNIKKKIENNFIKLKKKQKNGINQKKEENGIAKIQNKHLIKENIKLIFAKFAEKNFNREKHTNQMRAQKNAQLKEQTKTLKQNLHQHAEIVGKNSNMDLLEKEINIKDAQENVHMQSKKIVYNITLDKHNVYYANGILVKNCGDSFIMSYYQNQDNSFFH